MTGLLSGGTAVIIGAASGIGRATAIAFASEGCKAIALGDLDQDGLDQSCSIIQKDHPGVKVEARRVDIGGETAVDRFHSDVVASLGRIDFAVNSAGYGHPAAPTNELTAKEWDLTYTVNQKGYVISMRNKITSLMQFSPQVFLCERAQLRQMLQQEILDGYKCRGSIVNITSLCQLAPMDGYAAYAASKGAVLGLSKCDAWDYGPDAIRVNCVAPGNTTTPMLNEAVGDAGLKALAAATPLRRNATPEDVANAVVWLSSSRAGFITGTTLTVDGGYHLRTS